MFKTKFYESVRAKFILSLVCMFLCALGAFAQTSTSGDAANASLTGKWNMNSETPDGGSVAWILKISNSGGHWTGTVSTPDGQNSPASDFKVSGDKVHLQTQYQGATYDIDLKLEAGVLNGTWSGDNGSGKTTGKRSS